MFRFFVKSVVVAALVLAGYTFWPREPSLVGFSPREMADLNVTAWRDIAEGRRGSAMLALYRVYEGQYGLPPVDALVAAWNNMQAIVVFSRAADRADQEGALPFLENVFGILSKATGMVGDGKVAARLELFEWTLAADTRKRGELATVVAEKLALVHGASAGTMERAAGPLSKGIGLRAMRKWGAARAEMEEGFEVLKGSFSDKAAGR